MEERRNWPSIRNSNGTGFGVSSMELTSVESAYRRRSPGFPRQLLRFSPRSSVSGLLVDTRMGPVSSGSWRFASRVESSILTCEVLSTDIFRDRRRGDAVTFVVASIQRLFLFALTFRP